MSVHKQKRRGSKVDLLDELMAHGTTRNARFPQLVEAAYRQRLFGRELAEKRHRQGLSQTTVARRMGSTQRIVSKIENGGDVHVSTLARYVAALGLRLHIHAWKPSARAA